MRELFDYLLFFKFEKLFKNSFRPYLFPFLLIKWQFLFPMNHSKTNSSSNLPKKKINEHSPNSPQFEYRSLRHKWRIGINEMMR